MRIKEEAGIIEGEVAEVKIDRSKAGRGQNLWCMFVCVCVCHVGYRSKEPCVVCVACNFVCEKYGAQEQERAS